MSSIADEIQSLYGSSQLEPIDILHIGVKRRSGRYPYGSGDNPYQHARDFLGRVDELKKSGFTYVDEDGKKWTGDNAIAKSMGLKTSEYRRQISWANYEKRLEQVETAKSLKEDGLGPTEIGRKMGLPESTVRSLLNPNSENRMNQAMETAKFLKQQVDEKGMIDVGTSVNLDLNVSKERLDLALDYLEKVEGYPIYKGGIPQATNKGQQTNQKVLCPPGTEHKEIYNYDQVHTIKDYITRDGGETYEKKFHYPESLDSKRMMVRYKDDVGPDGFKGIEKDGVVEIRRGVEDLSLGESNYAQVRIMVDGTHYIKGMAVYSDRMPDGVDVVFNTNKGREVPMIGPDKDNTVLKPIKKDPDNPFGSLIKDAEQGGQYWYDDKKTGEKKLGLINKRADEGDWNEWSNALPSQFLGKQSTTLAKKQLDLAKKDKLDEFNDIMALNNPTIKKHLLEKFADNCDSAAVHLKAAALPGQRYHVMIPNNSLKDNEVYAPNYENGSKLALIRYPHGGTFEIPIVTVNNKNKLGRELIGTTSSDALCVNSRVAERLSGADFDGDTVMAIPTHDPGGKVKIASRDNLKGLEGFDSKSYKFDTTKVDEAGNTHYYRNGQEFKVMKNTGTEMGKISNLITDMTLGGAGEKELARAVKHSMVVIDAEKHKLDYKASEIENDIASLRRQYQVKVDPVTGKPTGRTGGASTILSRSKGETSVSKRQGSYKTNIKGEEWYDPTRPEGAKIWKKADDLYYPVKKYNKNTGIMEVRTADGGKVTYNVKDNKAREKYEPVEVKDPVTGKGTGRFTSKDGTINYKVKERTQESTKMAETDNAYTLVSSGRRPMELLYADYANSMKDLGNKARVELYNTGKIAYSPSAKAKYQKEVDDLMDKLKDAQLNRPRERAAQRMTAATMKEWDAANPQGKPGDRKKASQQALTKSRQDVGGISRRKRNIEITDKEWEAIQAGAISESKLKQILDNTDIDALRQRATPKTTNTLSAAKISHIKAMASSNYTLDEISRKMGLSPSTVSKYLKGGK